MRAAQNAFEGAIWRLATTGIDVVQSLTNTVTHVREWYGYN